MTPYDHAQQNAGAGRGLKLVGKCRQVTRSHIVHYGNVQEPEHLSQLTTKHCSMAETVC